MPSLDLLPHQMEIILNGARVLPPLARDRFLVAIGAELAQLPELGEGIISRTVRELQHRHFRPPTYANVVGTWDR